MAEFDLGTARGKIDLDASGAVKGSKQADDAFRGIDGGAQSASKSSAAVGTALVGFGAAAVLAFGLAVKASADFEKKISEFKSLGADYANNIDAIREKALQLGADTAFSAGEAADALVELGKQGLSTEEILNGAADATTSLAAAGGIDLAEAAGIAASALNQFKLEAKDLPQVADLLTGAANASATGVHEIGEAFKFVGPVAQAVGLSIKDTAGAIALLANNGIDAGQAGTALRAILTRLQPASKEAAGEMQKLGIITKDGSNQFFDAKGNIKSFADITDILGSSTSKLTAQQKAQALQTIFGTEALSAANIIAGEGKDAFLELQKAIGDVRAADVAEEKMNNLAGAIEEFKGSVETAMIRAGAPFQQGLTGIVRAATEVINVFSRLNPEIQKWIGFAVAGAGVTALVVGGIILLKDALIKARAAFVVFNAVIAANPLVKVVIVLAAVAAALFAAYKNIEPFRKAVDKLWETIQPVFDSIREKVGQALGWISNTAIPWLIRKLRELEDKAAQIAKWLGDNLSEPIEKAWNFIRDKIGTVVDWITGTAAPRLAEIWDTIKAKASEAASVIGPAVTNAFNTLLSKASEVKDWFVTNFGPAFSEMWQRIRDGATVLKDWFQNDFANSLRDVFDKKIKPAWESFLAWVDGTLKPAIQSIATTVSDAVGTAIDTAQSKMDEASGNDSGGGEDSTAGDKIISVWNTVVAFLQNVVAPAISGFVSQAVVQFGLLTAWVQEHLGPVFGALGELFQAIFARIGTIISTALEVAKVSMGVFVGVAIFLWNTFGETIISIVKIAWDVVKGIVEGALQILTGIINIATAIISGDWGKAWEGIVNIVKGAAQIWWTIIQGVANLIIAIVKGLGSFVINIIGAAWDFVSSKTSEIWNSFKDTISNAISTAIDTVRRFAGSIFDVLGRVNLFDIGSRIIGGLIDGVKSMFGKLQDAFNWVTDKIPDWKGPAEKDAKLLTENGELIMQSLLNGIGNKMGDVQAMLGTVAPMMSTTVQPALPPAAAAGGNNINIQFTYSGGNPDDFVTAVEGSGLLGRLTSAARSRRT